MIEMAAVKVVHYNSVTARLDRNEKTRGQGKIKVDFQENRERSCNIHRSSMSLHGVSNASQVLNHDLDTECLARYGIRSTAETLQCRRFCDHIHPLVRYLFY